MAEPVVERQRTRPLRELIRDALRTRIFEGHYAPGTRLIERDLAVEFEVSRLPIREALRMLQQEGVVAERAKRGSVVVQLSEQEVEDPFEVRASLEILVCRLGTERGGPADIAKLGLILGSASSALARGSANEAHRANTEFHDAITRVASDNFLKTALEPLQGRMHWLFRHVTDLSEPMDEHRELLAAITSGDPDRAAARSAHHVGKYKEQYSEST